MSIRRDEMRELPLSANLRRTGGYLRSSEDLSPCPTPHQNLVRIKTAIQPAILRLFMFMELHCNGVATVFHSFSI
jgi:hypothetical protein